MVSGSGIGFRTLIENIEEAVAILDTNGVVSYISPAIRKLVAYGEEDLVNSPLADFIHPDDRPALQEQLLAVLHDPSRMAQDELRLRHRDRGWRPVEIVMQNLLSAPGIGGVLVTLRDVSQRVKAIAAQRESERRFRSLLDNVQLISLMLDRHGEITYCNDYFLRLVGAARTDVLGRNWFALFVPEETRTEARRLHAATLSDLREVSYTESEILTLAGARRLIRWNNVALQSPTGEFAGIASIGEDVSDIRTTTWALGERVKEQHSLYLVSALASRPDMPEDELLHTVLVPIAEGFQYPAITCVRITAGGEVYASANFCETPWRLAAELRVAGVPEGAVEVFYLEERAPAAEGPFLAEERAMLEAIAQTLGRDLAAKRAEVTLARTVRALRTLSAGRSAVLHARSERELFAAMCAAAVETGAYRMAWIGLARGDASHSVEPVAWAGQARDYLHGLKISWADDEHGRGPTGTCIRTGRTQVVQNIAEDPSMAPWRQAALTYGFQSSIALPLNINGTVIGALMIYAAEAHAFNAEELALLNDLAEDLSYGTGAMRARAQAKGHTDS